MTLCGWKIFSRDKRKTKEVKADAYCCSSISDSSRSTGRVLQVKFEAVSQPSLQKGDSSSVRLLASTNSLDNRNVSGTSSSGTMLQSNPRNKCALKPGHSLMDWIRLGSSGLDLSGTKGVIAPVSYAELAKHCRKDDAWIAIRGKVFNVTHYMEFHPGGPDELMKGIGKDATKLFDDIHAWVNYEQLLTKCFIGPLRNTAVIDLEPSKPLHKTSSDNSGSFRMPDLSFLQTTSAKTSPVKNLTNLSKVTGGDDNDELNSDTQAEIIPRFDWIQKTSDLTLIFYTRAFCNAGLVISQKSDDDIEVRLLANRTIHIYNFKLTNCVNYPCNVRVSNETGKVEVRLGKTKPQLWTSFGVMEKRKAEDFENVEIECRIEQRQAITHDSYTMILQPLQNVQIFTPIGYHISITTKVGGTDVSRSYTPVPAQYCPLSLAPSNVPLLVKSYESGILSKFLTSSQCTKLSISQPKGNFMLTDLKHHSNIGLLAAGSGITPILAVLQYLLERTTNRVEEIQFLLFNKTEQDIWCRRLLETVTEKDNRLVLRHILSEPEGDWAGEVGRISKEIITPLADSKSKTQVTFCCVCGPTPFNALSEKLLNQVGFSRNSLHFFQG